VIGIAGPSGSGKTKTALEIARGMVQSASKIGFLDTENRRGSLYADELDSPFMIADLYPPFSPKRYQSAIKEFQESGVEVLIIDSVTHEWEGEGGCIEIAESGGAKVPRWNIAKPEHKKFMNTLLQSDMHIICCIRAREKIDMSNPRNVINLGMQPISEKNFMFEMTTSMMMYDAGMRQEFIKPLPDALKNAFGNGAGYIGRDTGKAIVDWVNSGDKTDIDLAPYQSQMQMACDGGMTSLVKAYNDMPKDVQNRMKPFMAQYKASAAAYDEQAAGAVDEPDGLDLPEPPTKQQTETRQQNKDI
jgi:hypothetical protein